MLVIDPATIPKFGALQFPMNRSELDLQHHFFNLLALVLSLASLLQVQEPGLWVRLHSQVKNRLQLSSTL